MAGTNATITNGAALWVQGGAAFGNMAPINTTIVNIAGQGSVVQLKVAPVAALALTATVEQPYVSFDLSAAQQFATGAITNQRSVLIAAPTYTAVGASTITNAATVAITGPPIASTNITLTNTWPFWVQAGVARFDGGVDIHASNLVTDTTTGMMIGSVGGASGQKIAFWGATPAVQPVCATGSGKTVDQLITILQTMGLLRQS